MNAIPEPIQSLIDKRILSDVDESADGLEFTIDALCGEQRYYGGREFVTATLFFNPTDGFAYVEENGRYTGPDVTCDGDADYVCAWIEEQVTGE